MTNNIFHRINSILKSPTTENILTLFDPRGYIRLNMLYIGPLGLKYFKEKLDQLRVWSWTLTETEMTFRMDDGIAGFRGVVTLCFDRSKIFALELDFDPVINNPRCTVFLKEVETFLKYCDACFFMTFFGSIDVEILHNPLSESVRFLATRK